MTTSLFHTIVQVAFVLAVVVGFIFLLGWMAKKTQGFGLQGGKHLKILQTIPLGQKEKAVLIELEGSKILLGVTGNQISTLWTAPIASEIVDPKKNDLSLRSAMENEVAPKNIPSFSQYLNKIMSRDIAC